VFDKVHGYGMPGEVGYRELLEESVGFMMAGFSSTTSNARLTVVDDEGVHLRPGIFPSD